MITFLPLRETEWSQTIIIVDVDERGSLQYQRAARIRDAQFNPCHTLKPGDESDSSSRRYEHTLATLCATMALPL